MENESKPREFWIKETTSEDGTVSWDATDASMFGMVTTLNSEIIKVVEASALAAMTAELASTKSQLKEIECRLKAVTAEPDEWKAVAKLNTDKLTEALEVVTKRNRELTEALKLILKGEDDEGNVFGSSGDRRIASEALQAAKETK